MDNKRPIEERAWELADLVKRVEIDGNMSKTPDELARSIAAYVSGFARAGEYSDQEVNAVLHAQFKDRFGISPHDALRVRNRESIKERPKLAWRRARERDKGLGRGIGD